jgi:hypothetical protein
MNTITFFLTVINDKFSGNERPPPERRLGVLRGGRSFLAQKK